MRNDWSMADGGGVLSARIESQTPISTWASQLSFVGNLVHHRFTIDKRCSINPLCSKQMLPGCCCAVNCSNLIFFDTWDTTCLMCRMLAQSNQNNQTKQLSSKHVSTSGMMNQLTFHSGFTTLPILYLLHLNAKKRWKATTKHWTIGKWIQWIWLKHWNALLSNICAWHNLIAVAGQKDRHAILMPVERFDHRKNGCPSIRKPQQIWAKVLHQFGKIEAFSSRIFFAVDFWRWLLQMYLYSEYSTFFTWPSYHSYLIYVVVIVMSHPNHPKENFQCFGSQQNLHKDTCCIVKSILKESNREQKNHRLKTEYGWKGIEKTKSPEITSLSKPPNPLQLHGFRVFF